jgi:hypothetical protein
MSSKKSTVLATFLRTENDVLNRARELHQQESASQADKVTAWAEYHDWLAAQLPNATRR